MHDITALMIAAAAFQVWGVKQTSGAERAGNFSMFVGVIMLIAMVAYAWVGA